MSISWRIQFLAYFDTAGNKINWNPIIKNWGGFISISLTVYCVHYTMFFGECVCFCVSVSLYNPPNPYSYNCYSVGLQIVYLFFFFCKSKHKYKFFFLLSYRFWMKYFKFWHQIFISVAIACIVYYIVPRLLVRLLT